jgi:hypothetical protein
MTNRVLVGTTLRILRNPGVWKIGFELGGLCVTGMRYSMVAKAIEDEKIACEAVDKLPLKPDHTLPPLTKILAQYDHETNTMVFPREDYGRASGYEQTVILHEATHAMFDLFAESDNDQVLAIDDESAAVLAQAHYMRLCGANDYLTVHSFSMLIDGPGEHALKLVDQMIAETGGFERDKRVYFLRPTQTMKLRAAVAQEWGLIKQTFPDGSWSDRTGVLHIYNGVVPCYYCWVHGARVGAAARQLRGAAARPRDGQLDRITNAILGTPSPR